jgi:LemA protein
LAFWVIVAVVALLAIWIIATYNRLIGLRNRTANGWRQIDVQLKRRHDLIPNRSTPSGVPWNSSATP